MKKNEKDEKRLQKFLLVKLYNSFSLCRSTEFIASKEFIAKDNRK